MRKMLLAAIVGAIGLLGQPQMSLAHGGGGGGGHGGGGGGGDGHGGGYGGSYHGGGGYGGGYHGGGYGGGYYGHGYYGHGYYGRGFGGGFYGGGLGYYYGYPGYDYGYGYPYYASSYDYGPSYSDVVPAVPSDSYYAPDSSGMPPAEFENPNVANLQILVPENAQLWIEGVREDPSGTVRQFYSPPLHPGQTYTYHIRARWMDASGKTVDRTKSVDVQAGSRIGVDFNRV
jgi:uncharacterized protein (TIGR03000 family)